jgi:hypothetical protein
MTRKLFAALYTDTDYTAGITPTLFFDDIADLGLRWSLPGGIQRIELTVRTHHAMDSYRRYINNLGNIITVFDNTLWGYTSGNVYEVVPDGRFVTYVCGGPWKRTNDQKYTLANFAGVNTSDTDVVIKDILTDKVNIDNTDQSNIEATSTAVGGWVPNENLHNMAAADAIAQLAAIGDDSDNIMDFFYAHAPMQRGAVTKPFPYLKARSDTANPTWQFNLKDLAPGGLTLARNIWNLRRSVSIGYGRLSGAVTTTSTTQLIDASGDTPGFNDKVRPGDTVFDTTDSQAWTVTDVNSDTVLDLEPTDHGGTLTSGDDYSVQLSEPQWVSATSSETDLFGSQIPDYKEIHMEMDTTQATQYATAMKNYYENPTLQQAFVVGSPTLQARYGGEFPLWTPFFFSSFYFRVNDLFPEAGLLSASNDGSKAFLAVAMDYTYNNNRLRVVPVAFDSRLDAMLKQAEVINAEIISTETDGPPGQQAGPSQ